MGYEIIGQGFDKTAIISGNNGKYGITNGTDLEKASIFGRNATDNFVKYNQQELGKPIDANNTPAFNYEVQYSPANNPNSDTFKSALMGVAHEDSKNVGDATKMLDELAKKQGKQPPNISIVTDKDGSVSLDGINKLAKATLGENASYNAYDIDNNGKIDTAENAVSTIIKDMSGKLTDAETKDGTNFPINMQNVDEKLKTIDGKFTKAGDINSNFMLVDVANGKSVEENKKLAKYIHEKFNLGEAMNKFLGKKIDKPAQDITANATTNPIDASKAQEPTDNHIKGNLKSGQGFGAIALQNKDALSKKYGTTKLWGEGGLVDKFAKDNGFKGFQDPELAKLQQNKDYDFKF
ncbi:MAG TPA: hypothetical protein DDW90_02545 [Cyanobacteria bacterium UBA9971]|nr:hypothetical protein [Cyanobacteria bacterium UBA9971]